MPAIRRAAVTETAIREHAYHLWEKDGRPHGRDVEYWSRATSELAALVERAKPAKAAAAPKTTAKPVATKAAQQKAAVKPPKAGAPKPSGQPKGEAAKTVSKPAARRAKA